MDRVRCPSCGDEHDLSDMEPSYGRPDAYLDVPPEERAARTMLGEDWCVVLDGGDARRYFLRVLLPMPVRGADACSWGVWAEVSREAYRRVTDRWDDQDQSDEPPFAGTLANALAGYRETLGLPGSVQLTGSASIPLFTLATDLDHPLAREQRDGVFPERVLEWLTAHLH